MTSRDYIRQKAGVMTRTLDDQALSYDCADGNTPIAGCGEMPEESEILRVLQLLDDVFFPGYRTPLLRGEPVDTTVIERLDEVYDILFRQTRRALPLRWTSEYARDHRIDA